ncbi:MAG: hypothetical protein U0519_00090 [Candidatus Gracilibacteria bacterium]
MKNNENNMIALGAISLIVVMVAALALSLNGSSFQDTGEVRISKTDSYAINRFGRSHR